MAEIGGGIYPGAIKNPGLSISTMNSPTITITKGLYSSDKTCEDVNINQVEQYLTDNNNCYERTPYLQCMTIVLIVKGIVKNLTGNHQPKTL